MAGLAGSLTFEVEMFHVGMNNSVQEKKMVEGYALALRAKELDPDHRGVYPPISMYAAFRGDWEGARRADEALLAVDPKDPMASNNLAVAYLILGEPQRAIDLETQAIKLNPKHPHEYVYFVMGMAYFTLGDNDAAIESLLKSLQINPTISGAYVYLAMAYALKGEDAEAHAAAAQFRQLEPNSTLSTHRETAVWRPPAKYKEWFESKLVPAGARRGCRSNPALALICPNHFQIVRPVLHHLAALRQIFRAVIGRAHLLFRSMCASCRSITSGRKPCSLRIVDAVARKPCAVAREW